MSGVERMSLDSLTELIAYYLPIQKWGFAESVRFDNVNGPFVIYDSQWCRIRFYLDREMFSEHLGISYGRLHAPNNKENI